MSRALLVAIAGFIALGVFFVPLAGIQTDEALFTSPIYAGYPDAYRLDILGFHLPLMVFPYIGALKTILYWPILKLYSPNVFVLRVPMVLAGALTILLLYQALRKLADARVALIACLLLAYDPSFLLMNVYDWGPVGMEHLLLVTAAWFYSRGRSTWAAFVLGLALWNKAVFIWALLGIVAAGAAVWAVWSRRMNGPLLAKAVLAFGVGVLPLGAYMVHHADAVLGTVQHPPIGEALERDFIQLRLALDGSNLFGYIPGEDYDPQPRAARRVVGEWGSSVFGWALAGALIAVPLWWRSPHRRIFVFAAVFMAVSFLAMVMTGGGTGGHHVVLLWPAPQILVAVVLTEVRPRWLQTSAVAVLLISNLLVLNEYRYRFQRNGARGSFTDAIYPLFDRLSPERETVYLADWGMIDNLYFLSSGALHLRPLPDTQQQDLLRDALEDSRGLTVSHVDGLEMYEGINARVENAAGGLGFRRQTVGVVPDSNGRPVFVLWRFAR